MFPSPPTPGTPLDKNDHGEPWTLDADGLDLAFITSSGEKLEEQSWFYYLAEIALRRIVNRILSAFYASSFESWTSFDVHEFITIAHSFELELETW